MAIAFAAPFLILLLASPTVFGTDYTVGDSSGWQLGTDYTTWAKGKTFKVGDTLLFKYDSSQHQVDVVDKSGYDGCSSSNVIKNYNDGNSKITLSKTGNQYYICPIPGHCSGGMKLAVNVVAASGTAPSGSPKTAPSGSPKKAPSGSPKRAPSGSPSPAPSGSPPSGSPTPTTPSSPSPLPSPSDGSTSAPSPKPNGAVSVSSGIFQLLGSLFVSGILLGLMI